MLPIWIHNRRWALMPLAIYASTRVFAAILLYIGAGRQTALTETSVGYKVTTPTPESPGYLGVISNWDGQWYRTIAENGYPKNLPELGGQVIPNEWAFAAGYPFPGSSRDGCHQRRVSFGSEHREFVLWRSCRGDPVRPRPSVDG